jgi:two-component system, chemotaxis family, chemotaxis protein CheY
VAKKDTVLIVDQDKIVVDLLIRDLTSEDLAVVGATSLDEAVRLIDMHRPAFLVIDAEIPNCIPFLNSVRTEKVKLKILAVKAADHARVKLQSMGIDTVDKGTGLEELVTAIRILIGADRMIGEHDRGAHVLVADDSDEMRVTLTAFLLRKGFVVSSAKNGREAVEQVKKDSRLQIALLDVSMPEMGGLDALKEIKKLNSDINVIVMTAVNDSQVARLAVESGAFDYILKPFSFDQMESSIAACLHHQEYEKKKSWWKW